MPPTNDPLAPWLKAPALRALAGWPIAPPQAWWQGPRAAQAHSSNRPPADLGGATPR